MATTTSASFHTLYPRWFVWLNVLVPPWMLPAFLLLFFARGGALDAVGFVYLWAAASGALLLVYGVNGLRNWSRHPVVEVSDEAVEYGSIYLAPFARRRIARSEVLRVLESGDKRIVVETHSGERKRIPLLEVRREERPAARRAIERLFAPA